MSRIAERPAECTEAEAVIYDEYDAKIHTLAHDFEIDCRSIHAIHPIHRYWAGVYQARMNRDTSLATLTDAS